MKNYYYSKLKYISFLICIFIATSCVTGTTLRTARTLKKGQFEVAAGAAGTQIGVVNPVVIMAYGVTDSFELEARWEEHYGAITPRFQILESENAVIDCLAFFEVAYQAHDFHYGPGLIIGRRFSFLEPYVSYRFRHYEGMTKGEDSIFYPLYSNFQNIHYVKVGSRLYLPSYENGILTPSKWFITLEVGPTISNYGAIGEWGINIGRDF